MPRTTVSINENVHSVVKEIAENTKESVSEVCANLIERGLHSAASEPLEEKIIYELDSLKSNLHSTIGVKIEILERLLERAIYVGLIAQKQSTEMISKDMSNDQFKAHQEAIKTYAETALRAQLKKALGISDGI